MNRPLATTLAGVSVTLWPERALHWPDGRMLFIADPHFGKAAAFRAVGIPAPESARDDLARLSALLSATEARHLVILGDFLHARTGVSGAILEALASWRAHHPSVEITLVRGNHDRKAGDPPDALRIHCVEPPWPTGPFQCRHEPVERDSRGHRLAGHRHPWVALRERTGARLRAACFVSSAHQTILPAFGTFTGLDIVRPARGDRLFVVGPGEVVELVSSRALRPLRGKAAWHPPAA